MLGAFDFYDLRKASPIMGPVFFFLYVVSITFVMMNMFLSILNEAFTSVRSDESKQSNDYEMVDFIIDRLKTMIGMETDTINTIVNEDDIKYVMINARGINHQTLYTYLSIC